MFEQVFKNIDDVLRKEAVCTTGFDYTEQTSWLLFLKYLLISQPVQQRIQAKGTGATVKGIKASLLKTIEISFPKSVAEQGHIVAKLDAISEKTQRLESIYRQKLAALEALKKSLLHQAFSGEL